MNWNTSIKGSDIDLDEDGYPEDEDWDDDGFHPLSAALRLVPVLFLCAVAALFLWRRLSPPVPASADISASVIREQLQEVKKLVTLEYHYTNADKYEAEDAASIFGLPLTGKRFIVIYDGVMKYGVDLDEMEVRVDPDGKVIRITIPHSHLDSHVVPEESVRVLDERDGLFANNSVGDWTAFLKAQKEAMEQKGVELGLPEQAEEQCKETIRAFLQTVPGIDEYTLRIETD